MLQPGWKRLDSFRERFGYPSTPCNMDGAKLYGVFVKDGKARLCSSKYPAVVWDLVTSEVPEEMAASPAVCFANQLWLVGGSAADPQNCSNQVWSYSPTAGKWNRQKDADWTPRLGHACVVFDRRIWVLGGIETSGNELNDVWNFDVAKSAWTCTQAKSAPRTKQTWPERCMHAATAFKEKIWIYGGVKAPFGDSLADIWRASDGQNWEQYTITKGGEVVPCVPPDVGKTIACALQVVNQQMAQKLHLLGTFRSGAGTKSWKCILAEGQRTWGCSMLTEAEAGREQGSNTFSLSSAEYKGPVFVRSLNYETANNPTSLNVYVP